MSKTLSAAEAKNRFADALRAAEAGETIEITRYGKAVAVLVGAEELAALRRLRAAGPAAGLASVVGRFEDGDDLADAALEVVSDRTPPRSLPDLGE